MAVFDHILKRPYLRQQMATKYFLGYDGIFSNTFTLGKENCVVITTH